MKDLLSEYDFKNIYELFNYMIESYVNGQKTQAREIFSKLIGKAEKQALQLSIVENSEVFGFNKCIEILFKLGLNETTIANSFYDYGTEDQYKEAKELIENLEN